MAVHDLYSKKQKRLKGESPKIIEHNRLPETLRRQILEIISDTIGLDSFHARGDASEYYHEISQILCREYGIYRLPTIGVSLTMQDRLAEYFECIYEIDKALDFVQLAFSIINNEIREIIDCMVVN